VIFQNSKNLESLRDEIIDYIEREKLVIYYGRNLPEGEAVSWANDDWKSYIDTAKKVGVNLIIFNEVILTKEEIVVERIEEFDDEIIDVLNRLKNHIGEIVSFAFIWIKDDIQYVFMRFAGWYKDYGFLAGSDKVSLGELELTAIEKRRIPKELREKTPEALGIELANYIVEKKYEDEDINKVIGVFLADKKIRYRHFNDAIDLKLESIKEIAEEKLRTLKAISDKEKKFHH
jgi:hypothetical protein